MTYKIGFILLLFVLYERGSSSSEDEMQDILDKTLECTGKSPPKEPVIALSSKRFSQLVALFRRKLDPPPCDKRKRYPPFNLEDPNTWPFCAFGKCENGKCRCYQFYSGPSCATYTAKCWLVYCFLANCRRDYQSLKCNCKATNHGTKIKTGGIYWYDEGIETEFRPPPPGFMAGAPEDSQDFKYFSTYKGKSWKDMPKGTRRKIAGGDKKGDKKGGADDEDGDIEEALDELEEEENFAPTLEAIQELILCLSLIMCIAAYNSL
ncbi:hypothetical protein CDAR_231751 [Caerostris darwini]|uniref:Uncharacterized protein n=1 Tax=Caerostris darwini TaxID=1538125 RepID=A0AAV4X7G1_9ARAC|nr:hypothetical protein CDAR_231631 [Caerostris darwini]GIY90112.1 hypothetical protein CDAR_231751 [Caerostris darwini]